jgi:glycosyltransferase involved in cell wall biosynthesis
LRVAVNALALPSFRQGGAGFYAATLIDGLSRTDAVEVTAVVSAGLGRELEELAPRSPTLVVRQSRASAWRKAGNYALAARAPERLDVGFAAGPLEYDLVHWPISFAHAPSVASGRPTVLTVLDMQHEFLPQFFSRRDRTLRRLRWRPSARAVDHVIAISEFTRRTVVERYGVPEERVTAIPLSARKAPSASVSRQPVASEPAGGPWFLYPASPLPAKNHPALLAALAVHRARGSDARLVLTGPRLHDWSPVEHEIAERGLDGAVVRLGHVSDADLQGLYARTTGLLFPSLFEGFGLPVLEAMAAGCPVACSSAGSLPEVIGDAGRTFLATDLEAIVDAMAWLERLTSADRQRVGDAGRARAAGFSMERMVRATVDVYRNLA